MSWRRLKQRPNERRIDSANRPSTAAACFFVLSIFLRTVSAQTVPATDIRLTEVRHLDLKYTFPAVSSREEWDKRSAHLKRQILASAGLIPMPARPAIKAEVFDRVDRGEYTIEKVCFASLPGFYVTGNLYRPKNPQRKVPGVLCPHGHWSYGRLENTSLASIPTRAANLARLGMVVFTYDMVGYNDSKAISHRFAPGHREGSDRAALWSINLLGLQLWNSMRSLDFLLSLPEVDPDRIGSTGASGGATQTFLHAAVDDRVRVTAPVNMISSIMQGGSLCENAPNLRIDTNNMELGALTAPRPMLMVSATGDWTRNTLEVEYPSIRSVYRLFDEEQRLSAIRVDAPHNYNQQSREAVYGWFAHFLLDNPQRAPLREKSTGVASLPELLVFYGRSRPADELDEERLLDSLIARAQSQLNEATPKDAASLDRFRQTFGETLRYSLLAEYPAPAEIIVADAGRYVRPSFGSLRVENLVLSRRGRGDRVEVTLLPPAGGGTPRGAILIAVPPKQSAQTMADSQQLVSRLVGKGYLLLYLTSFSSELRPRNDFKFFSTYNRTDEANRIQDMLTAIAYLHQRIADGPMGLVGVGRAGVLALLARALAPRLNGVVIDADGFDSSNDDEFIKSLPIPGIRRAGDFATAVRIAPFTPLLIHNAGTRFRTEEISEAFRLFGRASDLNSFPDRRSIDQIVSWLLQR